MRRLTTILGLILIIVLTTVQSAFPVTQTTVFQQGLGGYGGVRDTWVSSEDWDSPPQHTVNYGQNQDLFLLRDGRENTLIRFDLSQIPDNSAVISAILSLYNTTHSSYSGTQDFARRIELFCILRDWDEGNQVASPIDASGRHGATGDYAFDYYPGEGIDIPWGERGMARGPDYANTREGYADVINEGWYPWDITGLVQDWVRGKVANFGIVLLDATGYQDDNVDWRTFVSSQGDDGSLRPKLTVVFNPDTPMADAGPDQENLNWDRGPIILDGSASRDRPGGNNSTLTYSWRVIRAAFGSSMGGVQVGNTSISSFTPDVPGEWDIELRVSNSMGESATDTVHLRLLSIPSGHPRIYLTAERLAQLRARALPSNFRWTQLLGEASAPDGEMAAKALVFQVTGEISYCNKAVAMALTLIATPGDWATKAGDIALIYDWCFGCLTDTQRTTFINYFNAWGDAVPKSEDVPGWGNYWPRYGYSYGLMGLATHGENPRAKEWLDEFRLRRYRDYDLAALDYIREGGAWPEGTVYDWIANWPRVKAVEAWQTATGENLFESTSWYRNRLNYFLLLSRPGIAEQWETFYHPYPSTGDAERNRASMANYGRIMGLILIGHYGSTTSAQELQAYLSTPPADKSGGFLCHEEFLWFNPDQASHPPSSLTHYSPATGTLLMRSNWPDGAADQDPSATYITFQCGDHFTYHQHYDQNSFTLFKYEDLLVDSGVYSGEGLSYHDINYYIRSIAHNTLVVYNPAEDFSQVRADAVSNDGGQRTVYPASRSPGSLQYFEEHRTHYNTGDMVRFFEEPYYTYAFGDATKAYNNPTYNQAMDAGLMGNVAKVNRFHRELVYLRPRASGGPEYLVLFDRVSVTESAFSGENTKLLFHTLSEPVVNGTPSTVSPGEVLYSGADLATAVSGNGKVFIKVLLPHFRNIRKVGNRGIKAFWVFGANYDWHWSPDEPQPRPTNDFENIPYGEWRLELEPADTDLDHHFLTVLYPASSLTMTMPSMDLIAGNGMEGVHVGDPSLNRVVLFSSAADGSPPLGPISYTYAPTGPTQHLLFDLEQGRRYQVSMVQSGGNVSVTLTPSEIGLLQVTGGGTLRFGETGPEQQYSLTITKSGAGSGTVASDPAGINCGNDCSEVFNQETSVTLTATPATGSAFAGWSGACSGTGDCIVTMDSDKNIVANFVTVGALSVSPSSELTSSGFQGGPFTPSSRTYTLQNTGGMSIGWSAGKAETWVSLSSSSGSLNPGANTTVDVSINSGANSLIPGSYNDTITFTNVTNGNGNTSRSVSLTVNVPVQTHTVTTSPSGLQVVVDGTTYTAPHSFTWEVDSSHSLMAPSPQSGASGVRYVYGTWSDGGGQSHVVAPSSPTTYTASFTTQYTLTTQVNPAGGGAINPAGTNWCDSGQDVPISANANPGYTFKSWSGDLTETTNPTSIAMTGPKSVTGNFCAIPGTPSSPTPPDGANDISTLPTLGWSATLNTDSYEVYFGTTNPPTIAVATPTTPSYSPSPALSYRTTYYWQVFAKNGCGNSTPGPVWRFTTCSLPSTPSSPTPSNGYLDAPINATLSWTASDATSYDVYFGEKTSPAFLTTTASPTCNPGPLSYGKTYYWKVVAKNACGEIAGPIWSFRTCSFSVTPEAGTLGTELTIEGSGFGISKGKVLIGGLALKIVEWTATKILGSLSKVPPVGAASDVVVQPKVPKGTSITEKGAFTARGPEITSVPASGVSGSPTPLTIQGEFFSTKKGKVTLERGGVVKSCKVVTWTMDTITFLVPSKMTPAPDYTLRVSNSVGSDTTTIGVTAP